MLNFKFSKNLYSPPPSWNRDHPCNSASPRGSVWQFLAVLIILFTNIYLESTKSSWISLVKRSKFWCCLCLQNFIFFLLCSACRVNLVALSRASITFTCFLINSHLLVLKFFLSFPHFGPLSEYFIICFYLWSCSGVWFFEL